MNLESYDGKIAKENRRSNQEAEQTREFSHPFKLALHSLSKKQRQRREHEAVRKAMRRRK